MAGIATVQLEAMAKNRDPRAKMGVANKNIFLMPRLSASQLVGRAIAALAISVMLFTSPS
jgi:hypothetical protein